MIQESIKKFSAEWYKSWRGVIIALFVWPFLTSWIIWRKDWDVKLRIGAIIGLWVFIFAFTAGQNSSKYDFSFQSKSEAPIKTQDAIVVVQKPIYTPVLTPIVALQPVITQAPTPVLLSPSPIVTPPPSISPEEAFQEIGKKVAVESSVSALRQSDGSWVVTNVINDWPELFSEFGAKSWVRNFMYEIYHSNYQIKQAGVTVNAPKHIGKYIRAFVGINQAKTLSEEDWKYLLPSNFYNWLKDVETSREEPDRANRTFVEDNL